MARQAKGSPRAATAPVSSVTNSSSVTNGAAALREPAWVPRGWLLATNLKPYPDAQGHCFLL